MYFLHVAACLTVAACSIVVVSGEAFLKHDPRRSAAGLAARDIEFNNALASVMGCTSEKTASSVEARLLAVEQGLSPIWRVVPKDKQGNVEWRMLRYMAHRYFLQKSSLLIRGFEPARQVNDSYLGVAEVLNNNMPSLVESVLEGKRLTTGFSLADAVALVAAMEQMIFDSESELLEAVYKYHGMRPSQELESTELQLLLESYMVHWMIGDDPDYIKTLVPQRYVRERVSHAALEEQIPHWQSIRGFVSGMVKSRDYSRQHVPVLRHGAVSMNQKYSFDEAHEVVGSITHTFASYWASECQLIKTSLVALDNSNTGRIRLSDFYGANAEGEWRFGESEAYLRELGALDESSTWAGPQVILSNYIQGASNCIVTTRHYFVCCANECEPILNDIEDAVGGPVALPADILGTIGNITTFDDEPPKITVALKKQLQSIADIHGGSLPLHGRLFAQWLHYVFPRDCPFPHKSGTAVWQTPSEYGENYLVSDTEVQAYAAERNSTFQAAQTLEEERLMSQWSEEEELIADYSLQLVAPWESKHFVGIGFVAIALLMSGGAVTLSGSFDSDKLGSKFEQKSHFV